MLDQASKAQILHNLEHSNLIPKDEEGLQFAIRQTRHAIADNIDDQLNPIDSERDTVLDQRLSRLKAALCKIINPKREAQRKQRISDMYLYSYH